MKYEGHFNIGNNHSGKGDRLSRHWGKISDKKIRAGLQRIYGDYKKGNVVCSVCHKTTYNYRTEYIGVTKIITCKQCQLNKRIIQK